MFWKDIEDPVLRRKEYKKWWNKKDRAVNYDRVIKRERKSRGGENRDVENWVAKPSGKKSFRTREHYILHSAKYNARKKGKEFTISLEDIIIPEYCPILGIKLDLKAKRSYDSPSIDRINPKLGYIKGNVQIISWRANLIKSDMTIEECEKLLEHLRNVQ